MTPTDETPTRDWPRGLRMLGYILSGIGLLLLAVPIIGILTAPGTFEAGAVTADDFTNADRQANLIGTPHTDATSIYLLPAGNDALAARAGRSGVFFTPMTTGTAPPDGEVGVFITSPVVTGLTRETVNGAARAYLADLADLPQGAAMPVTLLPEADQSRFRALEAELPGVTEASLFVWPDHVAATEFGGSPEPPGFVEAGLTLLAAALAFGAAALLRRRRES